MKKCTLVTVASVAVLSMTTTASTTASSAERVPNIKGRVHATTDDSHFVMQTEKFFVRINRSKLSPEMQIRLLKASLANIETEVAPPAGAIDLKWPNVQIHQKSDLQELTLKEPEYFRVLGEKVQLRGTVGFSTDSSVFLILSGLQLYQLKGEALSEAQATYLESKNVGDSINLTLDLGKAQKMGSIQQPSATVGEPQKPDRFLAGKGTFEITGTLVHSFSDPLVIVQVETTFFQLKRNLLPKGEFSSPGKTVDFKAPMSAIDFVWSYERPASPIRQPAHFRPVD
ncbi:MAG: hypothetical protein J0L82_12520 [Deltaproteobacteria bacterium]|nr:hypothetical protein [Deltaproteobacteria bacterium]